MRLEFNKYEPNEIIRIIREWTGLTQEEFAKSINKKKRTIQDYEAGKCRYYTETLKLICKVHNIEITISKK